MMQTRNKIKLCVVWFYLGVSCASQNPPLNFPRDKNIGPPPVLRLPKNDFLRIFVNSSPQINQEEFPNKIKVFPRDSIYKDVLEFVPKNSKSVHDTLILEGCDSLVFQDKKSFDFFNMIYLVEGVSTNNFPIYAFDLPVSGKAFGKLLGNDKDCWRIQALPKTKFHIKVYMDEHHAESVNIRFISTQNHVMKPTAFEHMQRGEFRSNLEKSFVSDFYLEISSREDKSIRYKIEKEIDEQGFEVEDFNIALDAKAAKSRIILGRDGKKLERIKLCASGKLTLSGDALVRDKIELFRANNALEPIKPDETASKGKTKSYHLDSGTYYLELKGGGKSYEIDEGELGEENTFPQEYELATQFEYSFDPDFKKEIPVPVKTPLSLEEMQQKGLGDFFFTSEPLGNEELKERITILDRAVKSKKIALDENICNLICRWCRSVNFTAIEKYYTARLDSLKKARK